MGLYLLLVSYQTLDIELEGEANDQYQETEGKQECRPTRPKRCYNDRTLHVGIRPTPNSNMSQVGPFF
jgi:hypothetical protein